jgi:hypothetical protein
MKVIPVDTKHDLLKDFMRSIFDAHGLDFKIYKDPVKQLLAINSRLERRITQEATPSGRLLLCTMYWQGPDDQLQFQEGTQNSVLRLDSSQRGGVDLFRVTIDMEWQSGDAMPGQFTPWKELIYGNDPNGVIPEFRETVALGIDSGPRAGDIVRMSVPLNPQFPPVPKPLQSLGIERSHSGEFTIAITDY